MRFSATVQGYHRAAASRRLFSLSHRDRSPDRDEGRPLVGIVGWIILGFLAGVIAKAIMPGGDRGDASSRR